MPSPRYTILLANRNTGAVRRFTLVRRPALLAGLALFAVPTLVGLGARWQGQSEIDALRDTNESLRVENDSYRSATGELTAQISSLQEAMSELGAQAEIDPAIRSAMDRLPSLVKSKAMGGGTASDAKPTLPSATTSESPGRTFGVLRDLLGVLEDRLDTVRSGVEKQQVLAAATPYTWPITGYLTSLFGKRKDPFTGQPDFHTGLDIGAEKGTAVRATADGTVELASYNGNYGNCIIVDHGFGIGTRFGHLSGYAVKVGQKIKRGQVIGYVGQTGRATSPHLHYEILINGQPANPVPFLTLRR